MTDFREMLDAHTGHQLRQVGLCVYCEPCDTRLYQGTLPKGQDSELDARRGKCAADGHDWDNADSMGQCGFYFLCLRCGDKEWTE